MIDPKERDRVLLEGTFEEMEAMFTKAAGFRPSHPEVVERARHKAITALTSMPEERREASRRWLIEHNSEPWG